MTEQTSAARLGPSSYVILGVLAAAGPQTPYSLKQLIARAVGYYWPFPHAQVYAETARLASLGLALEQQEPEGLRRKRYSITFEGLDAVQAWLAAPTPEPAQLRDLGLLKLAFGSLASREAIEALRTDQVAAHAARLALYEQFTQAPLDRFLRATLELGIRYERTALEFWATLGQDDPEASAPAPSDQRRPAASSNA